jgi:hypothetical protein
LFSYDSIIAFSAQTPPDAIHPSKNQEYSIGVSKRNKVGEKIVKPKKNPTQVDVHIIQEISPEKNSAKG